MPCLPYFQRNFIYIFFCNPAPRWAPNETGYLFSSPHLTRSGSRDWQGSVFYEIFNVGRQLIQSELAFIKLTRITHESIAKPSKQTLSLEGWESCGPEILNPRRIRERTDLLGKKEPHSYLRSLPFTLYSCSLTNFTINPIDGWRLGALQTESLYNIIYIEFRDHWS